MKTYQAIYEPNKNKGVYGISLVENPAMEGLFIALKEDSKIQFKSVNEEQRILTGLALEPNKPIYRNQNGEEFNIVFSEETIKELAFGFLKNGNQKNSSLEHEEKITGVTFTESWIIEDEKNDKANALGFSYPKGSWMVTMKVDDPVIWDEYVKTGKVKGFSIDAMLSLQEVKLSKNQTINGVDIWFKDSMITKGCEVYKLNGEFLEDGTHELMTNVCINIEKGICTDIREVNFKNEIKMSEHKSIADAITSGFNAFFTQFKGEEKKVELGEVKTANGDVTVMYEGDELMAGAKVWIVAEDGTEVPLPVGEYEIEGGKILVVSEEGVATEIKDAMQEETEVENTPANMTNETATAIENAIKSVLIKYSEEQKKVVDELRAELKDTKEKLFELSKQPASKPAKSTVQVSEPKTAKERILQTIQNQ